MSKPSGKILVIRGGAVGDFILTLPVFTTLRVQFPAAQIEVLGYPKVTSLCVAGGLVNAARSIEERGFAKFFARGLAPDPEHAAYFAQFTVIVSYLYDPDGIFEANVTACSSAQFLVGPHRPDESQRVHATEVLLKPLERLAIFDADSTPRLALGARTPPSTATIALHPGSGSESKNWPEQNWKWLIQQILAQTTWNLLLIDGESEGDRLRRIAPADEPRVTLHQKRPLVEVAAALQSATAFLGHDSGLTHLAAALDLPGLALWGPSNEAVWHPRGARFQVLRGQTGLSSLTVDRVLAELRALVGP